MNPREPAVMVTLLGVALLIVAAALVALRFDARSRALTARVGGVARSYRRSGSGVVREPGSTASRSDGPGPAARLAGLLGFDPTAPEQHPAPWPVVVLGTALLIGAGAWYLGTVFGQMMPALALGPAAFVLVTRNLFEGGRQRYRERLYVQFPDALSTIVRAVRAGIPVTAAIGIVGRDAQEPTATQFRRMNGDLSIGRSLEQALWGLASRTGLPEYAFFAVALSLQARTGGSLTDTLENLADVVRKRVAMKARAIALAAEARTSALVLILVPVVAGGGLALLNPAYIGVLIHDPRGRMLLGGAVLLLATGVLTMRTIIRRSLA